MYHAEFDLVFLGTGAEAEESKRTTPNCKITRSFGELFAWSPART